MTIRNHLLVKVLLLQVLYMSFIGCKEDIPDIQATEGETKVNFELTITPEFIVFPSKGGVDFFSVKAIKTTTVLVNGEIVRSRQENTPYAITLSGEGFSVKGNIITATPNQNQLRKGMISISLNNSPSVVDTIYLTQGGGPSFLTSSYVLEGKVLMKWTGQEKSIDLSADPVFEDITEIAPNSFNTAGVTSLTIPDNVTVISDLAFSTAENLEEFKVSPRNTTFFVIDGVLFKHTAEESNGDPGKTLWRFPRAKDPTGYEIPIGTTRLGQYSFAWVPITALDIPEGVLDIQYRSFVNAINLGSITLPSSLLTIGNQAFSNTPGLVDYFLKGATPPNVGGRSFDETLIKDATLHVTTDGLNNYQNKTPWSLFKQIVGYRP